MSIFQYYANVIFQINKYFYHLYQYVIYLRLNLLKREGLG